MNEAARAQFWRLAEEARSRGKDLAEVLDRAGLLLTEQRRNQIKAETLESVADAIDNSTTLQIVRSFGHSGTNVTAADLHAAVVVMIREGATVWKVRR